MHDGSVGSTVQTRLMQKTLVNHHSGYLSYKGGDRKVTEGRTAMLTEAGMMERE